MYHGEVSVSQEELKSFLSVAEDLRGKGLTQNQSGSQSTRKENDFKSTFTPKQNPPCERAYVPPKRINPVPHPLPLPSHPATIDEDDHDQATAAVYQEEGYEDYQHEDQQDVNPDNADVESLMAKLDDGTGYMCLVCS